ncbi:uncharacterized protein LOC110820518 [Carica papaya]|uniref:uncharacterized protein LOC110820518 n=1 Tax=Carica papaya TaxID=3649 RepID=UPI000B8C7B42|nr:uncharacterized protein LOC110820518 [Carica papaya]
MEEEDQKELQLLPTPPSKTAPSPPLSSQRLSRFPPSDSCIKVSRSSGHDDLYEGPSVDLQLSISLRPIQGTSNCVLNVKGGGGGDAGCVEALKWQAAEQIRLAAIEKAYAERVRELTRREMELAQSEFARARQLWERAREEVEKAERIKERATRQIDSTCMEITCHSCRQRFRP